MVGLRAVLRSFLSHGPGGPDPRRRAEHPRRGRPRCLARGRGERRGSLRGPPASRRPRPGPRRASGRRRDRPGRGERVPDGGAVRQRALDLRHGGADRGRRRHDDSFRPLPRHHAEIGVGVPAGRGPRSPQLGRSQHPGRRLSVRLRRRRDDPLPERPDRGPHRLPGERLRRQQGADLRLDHPPRGPGLCDRHRERGPRAGLALLARVPADRGEREAALGGRARSARLRRRRQAPLDGRDDPGHDPAEGRAALAASFSSARCAARACTTP